MARTADGPKNTTLRAVARPPATHTICYTCWAAHLARCCRLLAWTPLLMFLKSFMNLSEYHPPVGEGCKSCAAAGGAAMFRHYRAHP